MEKSKILVIEDDGGIRTQMKWALNNEYDVLLAENTEEAIKLLTRFSPPLVTLDLGLPPDPEGTDEGFRLLQEILKMSPFTKVIIVTGNPEKEAPLRAVSMGAHDFFEKPINLEELKAVVKRANYVQGLEKKNKELLVQLKTESNRDIIGSSREMHEIFTAIRKVSTTDVPVLVTGESGTGKELVARAIHLQSRLGNGPFIPINCGAIPEKLMESELFGHEKGAYTGAHVQRKGKLELADNGTVFLDEIGDLPLPLQVKLLRVLQDHKLERVGGREMIDLDVRFLAATNKDPEELVRNGMFREDLYYRLAVVTIKTPALRERGEDILVLAKYFLKKHGGANEKIRKLGEDAVQAMKKYSWPGNVRELENKIQRAIAFAEGRQISASDLGLPASTDEFSLNLKKAKERLEMEYIKMALVKCDGNISHASKEMGLTRPTLHGLMKKYDITTKEMQNVDTEA
ncbi:MAG: PEP-CTERM-box response regulator transcription factor [Candidatus Scalindua sp.]|nr:PEP-CTERM-box response regulator transcription factor [Candidatus Scalindua sp.]